MVSSGSFDQSASSTPAIHDSAVPHPCTAGRLGSPWPGSSSSGDSARPPAGVCAWHGSPGARAAQQHAPPRLVQKAPARARPGAVRAANVKLGVPALLAYVDLWDVGLADLGAGEVDPGVALVALDHRPPGKRLHAEASDQVPGVVIWKEKRQVAFLPPDGSPASFGCTGNSFPSDLN